MENCECVLMHSWEFVILNIQMLDFVTLLNVDLKLCKTGK